MNVPRRHDPVATDTIFSDTPAVDSGVEQAQVLVGRDSLVADVYPMKSGKQFDEFDDPLDESNWLLQTRGKYMKFVIYHSSTAPEPRNTSNQKLVSFRKGIKREETAYPTLKDERYFDSFSRILYITAKSHEWVDVLDPEYTPSNSEKELFEAKQVFMFSVLDKHLLTDMGKIIVRKYVHTTDAQSVWKDFQEHMKSSSKGASEREDPLNMSPTQFWMTIIKVQQNNLYYIAMSSSGNLKKSMKSLNIFHHKSNCNYSKMQSDQLMI